MKPHGFRRRSEVSIWEFLGWSLAVSAAGIMGAIVLLFIATIVRYFKKGD